MYITLGRVIMFSILILLLVQLSEEPAFHLHDFVISPGNMLSGRGTFFAYLNDMIYRVRQGKFPELRN